jgi:N-methylhydantoinase A
MPIHVPMVDVRTVGAGGGSIARVDAGGLLRVGPESAGADPRGPVCYGRGGTRPTISDANLLLGRLDPPLRPGGRAAARGGDARPDRRAARPRTRRGRGRRGDPHRQHPHGRRDPHGLGLARRRSARLRALRLRRRRAAARARWRASSASRACWSRPGPADQRARLRRRRPAARLSCARSTARSTRRHGRLSTRPRRRRRPRGPPDRGREDRRHRDHAPSRGPPTCSSSARRTSCACPARRHPHREALQALFEAAYHARFRVELPTIRANLVNLNTSVIGVRPADRPARPDRPGRPRATLAAGPLRAAARSGSTAAGTRRRSTGATTCRSTARAPTGPRDRRADGHLTMVHRPGDRRATRMRRRQPDRGGRAP